MYEVEERVLADLRAGHPWIPDIATLEVGASNPFEPNCRNTPGDIARIHGLIFQTFFTIDEGASPATPDNGSRTDTPHLKHLANCLQHLVAQGAGLRSTALHTDLAAPRSDELSVDGNVFSHSLRDMVASQLGSRCPQLYRDVVEIYLGARYFGVDDLFGPPGNTRFLGSSPVHLLEKAIENRNIAFACILIENGANLALVPNCSDPLTYASVVDSEPKTIVVQPGDFRGYVEANLGVNSEMTLAIKASIMKREIQDAQAHLGIETTPASSAQPPRRKAL